MRSMGIRKMELGSGRKQRWKAEEGRSAFAWQFNYLSREEASHDACGRWMSKFAYSTQGPPVPSARDESGAAEVLL